MRHLALALLLCGASALSAETDPPVACSEMTHQGTGYAICEVDVTRADLRLFLRDPSGRILGHFASIDAALSETGEKLAFAMNAGMYHRDRSPVGHYVESGIEEMRVISTEGPGNFGLLPNGIFCIRAQRADVIETLSFLGSERDCTHATQSGPMLVIDGALHPRFLIDSTSRYVRNGVGTSTDGTRAVFVISQEPVTFHAFGTLFKDVLGLPNALYFDGNVSRLYAPQLGRSDTGFPLGPIVGVVEPAQP